MAKHSETHHEPEVTHEVTKRDPFETTVTDAPDFKEEPEEEFPLPMKTLYEQAAGRAALAAYVPPPPEEPPVEEPPPLEPAPKKR